MTSYGDDPFDDLFEDPFEIINRITGDTGDREGFIRAHAAYDRGPARGQTCPRCGRVGTSCKASYCVYG